MNKKGFTLIEILAVIVIIGVLIAIAVPSTLAISRRMKANMYCTKIEILLSDAKRWGTDHTDELNRGKRIRSIGQLIKEGYIKAEEDGKVLDPRDNESMNDYEIGIYIKNKKVYVDIVNRDMSACDKEYIYFEEEDYPEPDDELLETGGGADPGVELGGEIIVDYDINMVPVIYNSSGQTIRADERNTHPTYYWYDYCQTTDSNSYSYKASGCEFRWANAVLVTDTNRETYKSASPGTSINESDILAYLVYIPRYRYQLWNANNSTSSVQTINIEFENKSTAPSCGGNICTTNRVYSTGTNTQWLTHPAFTFGTTELNGIWVGKFETSPDEASACYNASSQLNCNDMVGTAITPRIKPNKNSWRYANVATMFTVSKYLKSNSMYGISGSSIDSHMMKNMEWGAVAYLSQSIYGKRGNQGTEIWINNYNAGAGSYNNSLTGCSGASVSASYSIGVACNYPYPNTSGTQASTTGTLYGIYDMSGGANEYVMGNMVTGGQVAPGPVNSSSSGFNGSTFPYPDAKYYDSYSYGTTFNDASAYARGYLGDATKEVVTNLSCSASNCAWNSDSSAFTCSTFWWFLRGGYWEDGAFGGVWFYNSHTGGVTPSSIGFRTTIVVE